jgi:hypothetical protein
MSRIRPEAEALESRRVLAAVASLPWNTELSFDQFDGGAAGVFARGYDRDGNEQPAFLGYEFCRSTSCGGSPFSIDLLEGSFGAEAVVDVKGRIGIEYGLYANAGSADLIYDGSFHYDVTDPGSGSIQIDTDVRYAAGGLFTQSPTARGFAEVVLELEGSVRGKACFIACTDQGVLPLNLRETITLIELNRGGNGQINILSSPIEGIGGSIVGELSSARDEAKQGARDQFKADRQIARARTPDQLADANQAKSAADQKVASGSTRENSTKSAARSKASGKTFGGGKIIQVSVGEAPGDLLGAQLEIGVGIGFKNFANLGKPLGSLSVTLPDIALADTSIDATGILSAATLQDDARRDVAKLSLDLGAILGGGFGLGTTEVDLGPLGLSVTTASYIIDTSLRLNQVVSATPQERIRFDFADPASGRPTAVDVTVNGLAQRGVTSIEFTDGDDVRVTPGSSQAVQVTPSLIPTFSFTNDLGLDLDVKGTLRALEVALSAFGKEWKAGPLIERSNPIGEHDFGRIHDSSFNVSGDTITFDPFTIGGPSSNLSVSAEVTNLVSPGAMGTLGNNQRGRFQVSTINAGPEPARNVTVSLRLPDELTVDLASVPSTCELRFQVMTCSTDELAVGQPFSASFEATPNVVSYQVLRIQPLVTSDSRDVDSSDNSATLEVPVTRGLRLVVVELGDSIDEVRRSCVQTGRVCNLRAAVEAANDNPGHDVILLRQATFTLNAPLDITDSVDIVALPGTEIRSDQPVSLTVLREEKKVRIQLPAPNGDLPNWTVADVVRLINRQTATATPFPFEAVQLQAELSEGDGSARLVFGPDSTIRLPNFTTGGTATTRATGNVVLDGPNNNFRLIMPEAGQANHDYNGYSLEIIQGDRPRFPMLRFGGPGENQYRLKGVTIYGGNATMGAGANGHGGAITLLDSGDHLRLDQVVVTENFAERGGGIAILGGSARITNSVIQNNAASLFGGGIHVRNAIVELEGVRIERNRAIEEAGGIDSFAVGGRTSSISVVDALITNNDAKLASAMQSLAENNGSQSTISIDRSVIVGNTGSAQIETFSLGGNASIQSLGQNFFDRTDVRFNGPGDITGRAPLSLESNSVASGQPGANVGRIVNHIPSGDTLQSLTVDDSRFEIVAGRLKLKPAVRLDRTQGERVTVTVAAGDDRGFQYQQVFALSVIEPPRVPTAVVALATSPDTVQVSWNSTPGDRSYRVLERTDNGRETIVASLPANSNRVTLENLPVQSQRTYVVEAVNDVGAARSTPVSVTLPSPLPEAPRDLQVESLLTNGARLRWQPSRFAEGYRLMVDEQVIAELDARQVSFTIDTLAPNQAASVRLVATNASGSAASSELPINTLPLPPTEPSSLRAQSLSAGSVRLQWTRSEEADEYRVFQTSEGGVRNEIARLPATATHFDVTRLDPSTRHELQVFAVNANGGSASVAISGTFGDPVRVDKVIIDAAGQTFDLGAIGKNTFPALHTVAIRGNQTATLRVTTPKVLDLSATSDALTIQAGEQHRVEYVGNWQLARPELENGTFYRVVTDGQAKLRLDQPDHHRNPLEAFDVNGDNVVSPIDALLVINQLNSIGARPLAAISSLAEFPGYVDTNGDGVVSPLDALLVINRLNSRTNGEGEPSDDGFVPESPLRATAHDIALALFAEEYAMLDKSYSSRRA